MVRIGRISLLWAAVAGLLLVPGQLLADGTEDLGVPSVAIASGSSVTVGGVGLRNFQPANLSFECPAGSSVAQVLLYWDGQMVDNSPGDNTIEVDAVGYTGTLIGGPTEFFGGAWVSAYRADITGHTAWGAGVNTISVGGLNFTRRNNGAGVLVVCDDGVNTADICVFDGSDLAFWNFLPPLDTTVPQTCAFTADDMDRTGDLAVIAGGAKSIDRPDVIRVDVGGTSTEFCNELNADDGADWDTALLPVTVPALADQLTTQLLSQDCDPPIGGNPESFDWIVGAFAVVAPPDDGDACTPGYWRNLRAHLDSWTEAGYDPSDSFDNIFGCSTTGLTLHEAVNAKGGGLNKLVRFAAASLLNSAHPDVDNGLSEYEVILLFCDCYADDNWDCFDGLFDCEDCCPID